MGKRGPAPKPSELKKMEGTYRADRAARNEPKPRVRIPVAPKWLTAEGKKEYRRTAKLLVELRVMTEADQVALASYAHEFDQWRRASDILKQQGQIVYSERTGAPYLHPMWGIANTHFKNMVKLLQEFGLTPASRTRVEAQPEEKDTKTLAEKLFSNVVVAE